MFPDVIVPEAHRLYAPDLGLLGSPHLESAWLALPAPATTAAALRAARPPKAAGLLLRGAGKASEADARRGEPSKPRSGDHADPHNGELQRTMTNNDELHQNYDELGRAGSGTGSGKGLEARRLCGASSSDDLSQ